MLHIFINFSPVKNKKELVFKIQSVTVSVKQYSSGGCHLSNKWV